MTREEAIDELHKHYVPEYVNYIVTALTDGATPSDAPTINVIPIPEDATNGDVIKTIFPNIDFTEMTFTIHATTSVTSNGVKGGISYDFWKDWWNAKYKGVSE